MKFKDYIFQDVRWHYAGNGIVKALVRCHFNSAYKFCILFRISQKCRGGGGNF